MKRFFFLLLTVALFLSPVSTTPLWSVDTGADEASRIFSFAEYLFGEGDYFRAITEYKRLLYFHPQSPNAEKAAFRIAEAYKQAGRWEEAIERFRQFLARYPQSPDMPRARYLLAICEKEVKRTRDAVETFAGIIKDELPVYRDLSLIQTAMIYLQEGDRRGAAKALRDVAADGPYGRRTREAATRIENLGEGEEKDPAVAGTLAAILPGAGHLYVGRYRDAAVAFGLNAAFIASAVELFRKDNNILGGIVSFVELGWYMGNIYSAAASAHKFNRRQREDFIRSLWEELSVDVGGIFPRGGALLSINRRF